MVDRPLLMSAPLVPPTIRGEKTNTRRCDPALEGYLGNASVVEWSDELAALCRYGVPGDRLWVREEHWAWGWWVETYRQTKGGRFAWEFEAMPGRPVVFHRPDGPFARRAEGEGWAYRHARFMPRALSRITLEIVSVRVERVQDISEEDARAEGLPLNTVDGAEHNPVDGWLTPVGYQHWIEHPDDDCGEDGCVGGKPAIVYTARENFALWWDHINGARPGCSWANNPWVWAVGFRRVEVAS